MPTFCESSLSGFPAEPDSQATPSLRIQGCSMEYMEAAVLEACQGVESGEGGPFGAAVVKDGKVIAIGHNMVIANKDPTCHAEVTAIRLACQKLDNMSLAGCSLYTSCYPCPMCLGACLWARLDAVFYAATAEQAAEHGFDDAAFHKFLQDPLTNRAGFLNHLPTKDTIAPFQKWSAKQDRIPY